jgi:hypothetical protein
VQKYEIDNQDAEAEMKRFVVFLFALVLLTGITSTHVLAAKGTCRQVGNIPPAGETDGEIFVKVSPNTIVIASDGDWITVHTNIAYSSVDTSTVTLNGVPVAWTKSDLRGNLVAKFAQADIKAIIAPPEATLVLSGLTSGGEPFTGSDTVAVK